MQENSQFGSKVGMTRKLGKKLHLIMSLVHKVNGESFEEGERGEIGLHSTLYVLLSMTVNFSFEARKVTFSYASIVCLT